MHMLEGKLGVIFFKINQEPYDMAIALSAVLGDTKRNRILNPLLYHQAEYYCAFHLLLFPS